MQQNSDIVSVLIRRVWIAILGLIIGAALAALVSYMMAPVYQARAYLLVAPAYDRADTSINDDIERRLRNDYTQAFSRLASDPSVTGEAVRESGVGVDPENVERYLTVSVSPNAPILEITANLDDPRSASVLATAVASGITSFTEERAQDTGYQAEVMAEASPSTSPVAPGWNLNLAVGAATGLLVGVMMALFWDGLIAPVRLLWESGASARKAKRISKENQRRARQEEKAKKKENEGQAQQEGKDTQPAPKKKKAKVQALAILGIAFGIGLALGQVIGGSF